MATTQTVANVVASLDRYYFPNKLISLALQKAPLTAWMPKDESAKGEFCVIRMHKHNAGGTGRTVAQAQASMKEDGYVRANLDWNLLYTEHTIGIPAIKRAEGGGGITDILQMGIKTTMQRHGDVIEGLLFGAGHGKLGQVATGGISGNVVTLTNPDDTFNFQPGMECLFDDTADGSSPRAGSDFVVSVDHSGGTVTFSNLGAITGEAALDHIFLKSLENGNAPKGLSSIIPDAAPTGGDNFGGLDRSVAPDELAGWRFTPQSGMTVTESLIRALRHGSKFGGKQDTIFMHEDLYTRLVLEQADRVVYQNMTSEKYGVNFRGVVLQGGDGMVNCLPSYRCPPLRAYALEQESWKLQSVNEPLIAVATKTGKYIDMESDDGIRLRWRSQFHPMCSLPGHNGVVKFAA